MTKKNLASLAKSKATTKPVVKKPEPKVEHKNTPSEDRDLKVKQKVEELLQDIKLTKEEEVKVVEVKETTETKKGVEWLEEQIDVLTERNTVLEKEAEEAKENYTKLYENRGNSTQSNPNPAVEAKVVELFDELQSNYMRMGVGPSGRPNFEVYFPAFLNRMILFFPFLERYKKFN